MSSSLGVVPPIGIIGVGVLGGVLRTYFEDQGRDVMVYDKFKGLGSVSEVNQAPVVFICVPTPYREDGGFDTSAVLESINTLEPRKTVVIRSTVAPGTTASLQGRFPQHKLFFNPEFLREKTALQDFLHPDRQIMGFCGDDREIAEDLLSLLPRAPFERILPVTTAELIKMSTNAFLALKIVFANQVYDLARALDIDYDEAKAGIAADPRIGASHMEVFDGGYRGFGGKCLPKDIHGLIDLADELGAPMELLRTAQELNEQLAVQQAPTRKLA